MTAARWRGPLQFALWAATGAGAALAAATMLTIGLFVLPATAALAAVLGWRGDRELAVPGIVTGLGVVPLYVAYLNRGGPGNVCVTTSTGGS
jgi:hypothetical protein